MDHDGRVLLGLLGSSSFARFAFGSSLGSCGSGGVGSGGVGSNGGSGFT